MSKLNFNLWKFACIKYFWREEFCPRKKLQTLTNFHNMPLPLEVKGLIFDCDGTLLDTMPLHWSAWCAICNETGLKFDKESFYALAGVPGREIIRELAIEQGITLDPLEVYARKRAFFLKGLQSVQVIPCVVRFALEARRLGIPIAVASGSSRVQVEQGIKVNKFFKTFLNLLTFMGNDFYVLYT